MKRAYKVLKAGGPSIFRKDMWRVTRILLTCTLEESTEHGVGTHDMQDTRYIKYAEQKRNARNDRITVKYPA
jgi:hypothetical protein